MDHADPAAHNPLMDSNVSDAVLIHTDAHLRLTSAELSRAGGQDAVALSDVVGAQAAKGSDVVEVFSYVRQGRCNSAPQRPRASQWAVASAVTIVLVFGTVLAVVLHGGQAQAQGLANP